MSADVFDLLASHADVVDAVNAFTRAKLWEDGFYRRIMPATPVVIRTAEEWAAIGVPAADLVEDVTLGWGEGGQKTETPFVRPWWETHDTLGAVAARRRREEAFAARLAARAVPAGEYAEHARRARRNARPGENKYAELRARQDAFANLVAGELLVMITAAAGRTVT